MNKIFITNQLKSILKINRLGLMRFSSSNQTPKPKEKNWNYLNDTDDMIPRERVNRNQKKEETYTTEELENIHREEKVIKIMEISEMNFKKMKKYKSYALYFNLPLAICLPILNEFYLSAWSETSAKASVIYHLLFVVDIACFGGAVGGLMGLRNIVILCNYITKDRKVEFTKLDFLKRPYKIIYDPEELKRVSRTPLTPFLSLKHKKKNEDFSMSGIGKWSDIKLFNTIFPLPKKETKQKDPENPSSDKEINKDL